MPSKRIALRLFVEWQSAASAVLLVTSAVDLFDVACPIEVDRDLGAAANRIAGLVSDRAAELAKVADRAGIAGLTCEQRYLPLMLIHRRWPNSISRSKPYSVGLCLSIKAN